MTAISMQMTSKLISATVVVSARNRQLKIPIPRRLWPDMHQRGPFLILAVFIIAQTLRQEDELDRQGSERDIAAIITPRAFHDSKNRFTFDLIESAAAVIPVRRSPAAVDHAASVPFAHHFACIIILARKTSKSERRR